MMRPCHQVDGKAASRGDDMPFQQGGSAARHHGHVMGEADRGDAARLLYCLQERDRIGQEQRLTGVPVNPLRARRGRYRETGLR